MQLALKDNKPRMATIKASGDVECARLDRNTFTRILGPLAEILAFRQYDPNELLDVLQVSDEQLGERSLRAVCGHDGSTVGGHGSNLCAAVPLQRTSSRRLTATGPVGLNGPRSLRWPKGTAPP